MSRQMNRAEAVLVLKEAVGQVSKQGDVLPDPGAITDPEILAKFRSPSSAKIKALAREIAEAEAQARRLRSA